MRRRVTCNEGSLTGVNPRVTVTRVQAASDVAGSLQLKLPAFGGLTEGVATLTISQNSTGSEVAEAIRSAAVIKDEISCGSYMLDSSEVTAVLLPRYKASYGAGRAWDVTFHRLNSTGGVARTARNVPELIIDARLASNSSVNAKWTVSTRRQGQASCQGDQPGAAWNLGYGGNTREATTSDIDSR